MKNIFENKAQELVKQVNHGRAGYAMLFAVLVSSVLLSIGLSIFNLTIKELVLSSSGRESQFSFYSADTGAECALYWDFKSSYPSVMFATSSGSQTGNWRSSFIASDVPSCVGNSMFNSFLTPIETSLSSAVTQFTLDITATNQQYCAIVTVTKSDLENDDIIETVIDSRGYNTRCDDTVNPNRVERALKVTY